MNRRKLKSQDPNYSVGYGRPPAHTRFRRGISGNPGGRPRGRTASRVDNLILKEAYRPITVRDGDQVMSLPAVQAVIRALIARAAKGNGPAQRLLVSVVAQIEQELAASKPAADKTPQNIRITWVKALDGRPAPQQPVTPRRPAQKLRVGSRTGRLVSARPPPSRNAEAVS